MTTVKSRHKILTTNHKSQDRREPFLEAVHRSATQGMRHGYFLQPREPPFSTLSVRQGEASSWEEVGSVGMFDPDCRRRDISLVDFGHTDDSTTLLTTLEQVGEGPPTEMKVVDLAPEMLTALEEPTETHMPNSFDVKVLDGAAVVHLLSATGVRTFEDYASDVFLPYIVQQLENSSRVDIVWDRYAIDSIKESARQKRGKGTRRKVAAQNKLPGQWQDFLCDADNKQELFKFLSEKIKSADRVVMATYGEEVVVTGSDRSMPACNHEEADTRMLFHLQDALQQGSESCLIRTVDTDVLVILTGKFHQLEDLYPKANIWVAFGTGKKFSYIHINAIAHALGRENSTAMPVFHSFTGCDTVSSFLGKGKKTGWDAWKAFPGVTEAFTSIAKNPLTVMDIDSDNFRILERFTVILYQRTSPLESVNDARREMFCRQNRTMEAIPPTQSAPLEHAKRAAYQAGIWSTCDLAQQQLPTPDAWGWKMDRDSQRWTPVWTTLPMASRACGELVRRGCKAAAGCTGKCACKKALWTCTELCKCNCIRNSMA